MQEVIKLTQSYADYTVFFKAVSDETRLRIIEMLFSNDLCACDILENVSISQSTLSYHMKMLTDSGLVNGVRDGAWMRYSINEENFNSLILFLNELSTSRKEFSHKDC